MHHALSTQRLPWSALLLALSLVAFAAPDAAAQQRNWDEGASPITSWTNATNWNANNVPDSAGEDAAFNDSNGDDLDCTLDTSAIVIQDVLMLNDYDGTLTLNQSLTCRDFLWNDGGADGVVNIGASGSLTIGRSADISTSASAATLLVNTGGITFNGAQDGTWDTKAGVNWGNVTIDKGANAVTLQANTTVNNLVINSGTLNLGAFTLTVLGTVTINDGTLNVGTGTLDATGLITVGDGATAAALTVTSGEVQAGGGLSVNATDGTYTAGTGTLTFDGAGTWSGSGVASFGTVVVTANVSAGSALTAADLTLTGASLTLGAGNHLTAAGISGTGTLNASGLVNVTTSAGLSVNTYTGGTGTLTFTGAGAWTSGGTYTNTAVTINTAGSVTTTGAKTIGALTLTTGTLSTGADLSPASVVINAGNLDVTGDTLTVTNAVTINDGTLTVATGTLDAGGLITVGDGATAAALTVTNGAVQAGGGLTVNALDGTYTAGTGTLTFDGAGTWTGAGSNYGAVVVTANVNAGSQLSTGSLTLTGASLTLGAGNHFTAAGITGTGTLNASGAVNVATSGDLSVTTYTQGTGILTFNGAGTWSTAGPFTTTSVVISAGGGNTVVVTGNKSVAMLTLTSGTLNATGDTVTVSGATAFNGANVTVGTGTLLDLNGAVSSAGGTVTVTDGEIRFGNAAVDLSGVTISDSGGTTRFDFAGTTTLTLGAGNTFFDVFVFGGTTVNVGGAGGFTADGGLTVNLTGTLNMSTVASTIQGALVLNGTLNLGAAQMVSVGGNVSGTGSLGLSTSALSVAGATVTMNGLTVTASGIQSLTLNRAGDQAFTPSANLRRLVINTGAAGDTVTVTGGLNLATTLEVTRGILLLGTSGTITQKATVRGNGTLRATAVGQTYQFTDGLDVDASGDAEFLPGAVGGMTVIFGDASTSVIAGTLTATGFAGNLTNYVTLRDQSLVSDGTKWNLTRTGTVSATRVRVQDSVASANIDANTSDDLGGNTNWTFLAKTTRWISAVAGNWNVGTNWSAGVPADGDTVEFSAAANGNSTVNIAGLDLDSIDMSAAGSYTGTLIINQALMTSSTTTTSDFRGTVNANAALTVDGDLDVNGVLNATAAVRVDGVMTITGTVTHGANTLDLNGNVTGAGTLTAGTGNVQFGGGTVDLNGLGYTQAAGTTFLDRAGAQVLHLDATSAFTNLNLGGAGGAVTMTGTGNNLDVGGTLTVGAPFTLGTGADATAAALVLNTGNAANVFDVNGNSLTVSGNTTLTQGVLEVDGGTTDLQGGTLTTNANATVNQTNGTLRLRATTLPLGTLAAFNVTNGTTELLGAAAQALQVGANVDFDDLTVGAFGASLSGGLLDVAGNLALTGNLTTGANSVDVEGNLTGTVAGVLNASTAPLIEVDNAFTPGGFTAGTLLRFTGTGDWGAAGGSNMGAVEVTGGTRTLLGPISATGLTVSDGVTVALGGFLLTSSGGVTVGGGASGTLGDGTLSVGGNLVWNAGSTATAPLDLIFTGATVNGFTTQGLAFRSVTVNKGTGTLNVTGALNVLANGATVTTGTLALGGSLTSSGPLDFSGGTFTMPGPPSLVTLNFAGTVTVDMGLGNRIAGDLTVSGGTTAQFVNSPLFVGTVPAARATTTVTGTLDLDVDATFSGATSITGTLDVRQGGTTIRFGDGQTTTWAGSATILLDNLVLLDTAGGTPWNLTYGGATLTFNGGVGPPAPIDPTIANSNASGGPDAMFMATEGGGNTGWTDLFAPDSTWTGLGLAGDWSDPNNWDTPTAPGPGSQVVFPPGNFANVPNMNSQSNLRAINVQAGFNSLGGAITLGQNMTLANNLVLANTTVQIDLGGNVLAVNGTGNSLALNVLNGTLRFQGGTQTLATPLASLTIGAALVVGNGGATSLDFQTSGATLVVPSVSVAANATLDLSAVNASVLDANGDFTLAGSLSGGANTVRVAGNMNWSAATAAVTFPAGGVLQVDGGVDQLLQLPVGTLTLRDLVLQKGGGTLNVTGGTLALNAYTQNAGSLSLANGLLDVGATLTLNAGTLSANATPIQVAGNWNSAGALFVPGTSLVTLDGVAQQTVTYDANTSFSALTVDNTVRVVFNAVGPAGLFVAGNLIVNRGEMRPPAIGAAVGGSTTFANNATLDLATPNAPFSVAGDLDFTNGNLTPASAAVPLTLDGAGNQTLTPAGESFGFVAFTGGMTKTLAGGDLVTNARVSITAGTVLDIDGNTLRLTSNDPGTNQLIVGTGAFADTAGTGTIEFATNAAPAGGYLLGGFVFPDLTLNPAVAVGFSNVAPLTITRGLTLTGLSSFTNPNPVLVGTTTQIDAGRSLVLGASLTSGAVAGAGSLTVSGQSLILTGTVNPFSVTTVNGLLTSTITYQNGGNVRAGGAFTYGNLAIGAGTGVPGGDLRVSGNLTFTAATSNLDPATNLFFLNGNSIFDAGTAATVTLNQLDVSLTALGNTLQLIGSPGLTRTVVDLQVRTGELQIGTDWAVGGGTVGVADPALVAKLSLNVDGASLTLGGAGTRTLVVNDTVEFGNTTALGLSLVFNNLGGAATIAVDPTPGTTATLSFQGAASSTLAIVSNPDDSIAQITGLASTITAVNVSVQDNDASGVTGGPIVADGISVDLGLTTNWEFTEGGSLRIAAASILGDGDGSVDRVRVVYTQPIETTSVGNVHERYELRLTDGSGNVLLSRVGGSSNVVTSSGNNVLDIVLAAPMPQTHTTNLQFVYTPPTSGFLTSDAGIPAATAETATPGGAPPLFDAADPVISTFFFQDADLNGGAEALVLVGSEPLGSSSGKGIALGGFGPVTSTANMVAFPVLYLQVAGQGPIAIDLTPGGIQRQTGDLIAQRITQIVRAQSPADPLLKPAFVNFSCTYDDVADRFVLQAGVPLQVDGLGNYSLNWAGSTVAVLSGPSDAAPFMRLGTANGGVEFAGFGDAQVGLSVSAVLPTSLPGVAGTTARFQFNGEDFRAYPIGGGVTTRASLASELQTKMRAVTNEAQSPASQVSYSEAVVIDDTARNRLVVVPGGQGAGVRAVAGSEPGGADPFASVALVGSDNYVGGAVETAGADNTLLPTGDLNVVGVDGSNMLLGAPPPLLSGNTLTFLLSNAPGAGPTPSFRLADNGDGGFIRDQASVPNFLGGALTNLTGSSNIALIGDTDGDLTLDQNPGGVTLDASLSVPYFNETGTQVTFSWDYQAGPGPISIGGSSIAAPSSAIATTASFGFSATTPTPAGTFYEFVLTLTVLDAGGNPVVSAQTDANGQQRVVVRVTINSLLPVALAGPDQVAQLSAQLDGSASFDPNGGALTFAWQATTSAGSVLPATVFDDPTSATPVFTPNLTDTFTVTLGVTKVSNTSQISSDTVSITIFNPSALPPNADAGQNVVGRINVPVSLDGSQSVDPQGGALIYEWSLGSAPAPATLSDPAGATPTFTPSVPGTYVWNLVVRATNGQFDSDVVQVLVQDDSSAQPRLGPSAEPRALGVYYGVFPSAAPNAASSAIGIYPGGVEVTTTLVDLTGDTLVNPQDYELDGLQAIRVIVNQSLFGVFYVAPPAGGPAPVALRFPDGQREPVLLYGEVGQSFILDGSASQDDGVITTFSWTQLSGPFVFQSQTGAFLSVVPPTAGTYVFSLVVIDNINQSSFARSISIPVIPAGNPNLGPPWATASPTGGAGVAPAATAGGRVAPAATVAQGAVGTQFQLSATGSVSNSGGSLTYAWTQLSGPVVVTGGADTQTVTALPTVPGAYQFEVTVTDQNGTQQRERVWVTVAPSGGTAPVARIATVPAQTIPASGVLELTLNGQRSSGASSLTYHWSQTRGSPVFFEPGVGAAPRVQVRQPGIYTFELRVGDGQVRSSPAEVTIFVEANQDLALSTGATTSSSSGGCTLGVAREPSRWGWALALLACGLVAIRRREAGSWA